VELQILSDITIIFGISLIVGLLCNRMRIPPLVAFIITGVIAGPHALSIIQDIAQVEVLAEIGIILLLFTIGLEFSFTDLWRIKRIVLASGAIQVALTFLVCFALASILGRSIGESILLGFLISLSSTAVVLKILHQRGDIDSPHGNIILGTLIFQDIIAVPMIMAIPFLASIPSLFSIESLVDEPILTEPILTILGKDILVILILVASAKWLLPWFLFQIARTRNRELFLLFIIVVCFGVAWLVSFAGVSLALGALLAGLLISESEYSHQAISNILPFRDIFTSFFFVSVGMLLDIGFLVSHFWLVIILIVGVVGLKAILAATVPVVLGYPIRTITMVGLGLAQIGEFSFIISRSGFLYGILSQEIYQAFLVMALVTMAITPFVIGAGPRTSDLLCRIPYVQRHLQNRCPIQETQRKHLVNHLVIIGYGITGRNLAHAARAGGIPYTIIELNPETVRSERAAGEPIAFGDATNDGVLSHADIEQARIAVVAINDPVSTRKIVELCRRMNPDLFIIVRTRYLIEVKPLQELGANEVIPEEFETSVEIFTRVLHKYLIPRERIERFIGEVRSDAYQVLRNPQDIPSSLSDLVFRLSNATITSFTVGPASPIAGKTLGEVNLRKKHSVLVLAVLRGGSGEPLTNPGGDTALLAHDTVIVQGTPDHIAGAAFLFHDRPAEKPLPSAAESPDHGSSGL
jgi:monovalent cation:H+ antiporter-2, CPA2 family